MKNLLEAAMGALLFIVIFYAAIVVSSL